MALERALKTRDIVLFNVAAIVGMRWIALAAANGPSSLFLWVLAGVAFFIPQGFAVTALASAIPEEGGLYVWTKKRLRRAPRVHGRLALLGQQHPLLPDPDPLDRRLRPLRLRPPIRASRAEPDVHRGSGARAAPGRPLLQHHRHEVGPMGAEHRWDRPVDPVRGAASRRSRGARALRLGHADPGGVARAGLRGASDDPLLRQSLLRIRRPRARARDGRRGRRASPDVSRGPS